LSDEYVDRLVAYSEGINRYIESHLHQLPLEFRLLRYEPEPWRPEDSLTIGKGFAFFLSTSFFTRLTLSLIADKLGGQAAKLESLSPAYPAGELSITRAALDASQELLRFVNGSFKQTEWGVGGQGSNNWVIAPHRSATEKAILCNDPHLRMTLPSLWYLVHLRAASRGKSSSGFEVWGGSIPGSPCIHLGFNRRIAWGVTAAVCDDADLYREKIHPENADVYAVGDQWVEMEHQEERIRIRGGKEVTKRLRFTRHGPIVSDFIPHGSTSESLALRWTAHDPGEEARALYGVNRASDWEEFLRSLSYQIAPTLNYLYADREGNIGYALAGRVPLRRRPHSLLPLPGWNKQWDWQGYIPFHELPRLYNPPEGVIATANNKITDSSYPHYLSDLFDSPYRIRRIKELLTKKERFSLEEMADIQRDTVSIQGRELVQALREDLEAIRAKNTASTNIVERLMQWEGDCSESSAEAALFHVFYQRLMHNLLSPDLGEELFLAYAEIFNQSLVPIDRILRNPQSPWFDAVPRRAIVEKSLTEAETELAGRLGTDTKGWSWGKLHTLTLHHTFDRSKILEPIFSVGPFPSSGDGVTINMGFFRHSNPYQQIVGPSMRMLIDLGDWRRSSFILPSGQSGHPFSPHYKDQTELWRSGKYIRLFFTEEEMDAWRRLILTPTGENPPEKR
jgi:penicillin amidase